MVVPSEGRTSSNCVCLSQPDWCSLACSPSLQGESDNGVMTVRPGDLLTVSYSDQMPTSVRSDTVKVALTGVLRLSPAVTAGIGEVVGVVVFDDDMNGDATQAEHTVVDITSPVLGEPKQQLVLLETALDSGHFTGVFTTCLSCSSRDGLVRVEPGDVISVTYTDTEVPALAMQQGGAGSVVSAVLAAAKVSIECSPKVIMPGEVITVVVLNADVRHSSDQMQVNFFRQPEADPKPTSLTLQQAVHEVRVRLCASSWPD